MCWTQTAATEAVKEFQAQQTALAAAIANAKHSGLADRVRRLFLQTGDSWSCQEIRTALTTKPGYPTLAHVNGAIYGLIRLGEVERTTPSKRGWGPRGEARYRRITYATDET